MLKNKFDIPVDFEAIEQHKENIEPLREGRSALALKEVFSVSHDELKSQITSERTKLEANLDEIDELDDPIQPFLDYIQWILKNYPSGRSVESGLIRVLERCTSQFRDSTFYKNDPRYLSIWLKYAKYSDNPRDIFVYLARKEIGKELATFYEEYSNFLEMNNRNAQAEQVYLEGITQQARPLKRLEKRYNEFRVRLATKKNLEQEPQSPALPTRSALSVRSGTLFTRHEDESRFPKQKIEIFEDSEGSDGLKAGGWDNLGSSTFRNKENMMKAVPWVGETIKQDYVSKPKQTNFSVFNDDNTRELAAPVYKLIQVPGKKPEKIDLNFDLLYQSSQEFCIQEVLAISRRFQRRNEEASLIETDIPFARTEQIGANRNDTNSTVHLANPLLKKQPSPTATLFTREARDEIYSMFDQTVGKKQESLEDQDASLYYDYTEQLTRTTINNLNNLTERVDMIDEDLEIKNSSSNNDDNPSANSKIVDDDDNKDLASSPFVEKVCRNVFHDNRIINPMDEAIKNELLKNIEPSLKTYDKLFFYNRHLKLYQTLKKSINSKQTKQVFVEFEGTESTYNLKSLLGEGGYASVYLAECMDGDFKAIKAQKPSDVWEFYIIYQINSRLKGDPILNSVISCEEMHYYEDESYLLMDYIPKGTVLDVVNSYRARGENMDEPLVIFLTVELLKVIESLHKVGIMHGDLKPDNCMIRFDSAPLGAYDSNGSNGWRNKGMTLIDFGRSIDMTLFPEGMRFKSNWKTDHQDCPEMRNNESWTFEADYYGIANIIHTMLYGYFIETSKDGTRYKLSAPIKRYWQQELWNPLFELLLNSKSFGALPLTTKLREHRYRLEDWLSTHSVTVVNSIKKLEGNLR